MTTRKLGNSGLEIPALVFGGNVFGWTADSTSFRLLDALLDAGLNCIDTADVYSRWVPGTRAASRKPHRQVAETHRQTRPHGDRQQGRDGHGQWPQRSLRRLYRAGPGALATTPADRLPGPYQSHTDDPHTDLEETLSTYGELIKKGKVRVIGASNYDARRLLEARQVSARLNLPSYQSLQPEYNLYDRADYETNLEPTVEELGIGVISYSLASGFLSGKYRNQADTAGRARERR